MDQPDLEADQHRKALRGLARINFWSRSASILWKPLCELQRKTGRTLRVLDVATGGGDVVCRLARKARGADVPLEFAACDVSQVAVDHARDNARRAQVAVDFFVTNILNEPLPSGFDVVMCSLFLHHLTENQVVHFLEMSAKASPMILINDLLRSRGGLLLAQVGSRILSSSAVVHVDGPRSVEGAFTVEEVSKLAARAGLRNVKITKCWPRRFLLTGHKDRFDGEL
jgi:2-polyprenyl-3-methyl-5-hydroxy-6-metoxy-1,4-benzoquinol methylase